MADYFEVLEVSRTATDDEIKRAYRELARKTHPDVDKTTGAGERFKAIAEAYEVLKDKDTRARYDALGANWREGQDFTPPPDFQSAGRRGARTHGRRGAAPSGDFGSFSSFFESIFGDRFDGMHAEMEPERGASIEAELEITLEEAVRGGKRTIRLDSGDPRAPARTLEVTIPKGISAGATMRLAGQGHLGASGPGDLLLRVRFAPHPRFNVADADLTTRIPIPAHDAVLGAKVPIATLSGGEVVLNVPPGTSSGKVLRLRGLGLERRDGTRGDLLVEIAITVPSVLDESARKLWTEIKDRSQSG